ncbi:type I toxin-antitoxin system Ibs family toxin [Escherichia coli]|nr:type I toxin-antitoxin system Ibs family toxin [Escherichia coli]NAQ97053.1 type I toxin-antitoxin system Ibs family toxin [Escherichia coli]
MMKLLIIVVLLVISFQAY